MQSDRLDIILEHLKVNGKASFAQLAKVNGVSVDTVRRDLAELEERGLVQRVRGGAVICDDDPAQKSFGVRSSFHNDEKRMLCNGIKEVLTDGQTVALNSGTTNIEAAKFICENYNRLNIITNSLVVLNYMLCQNKFNIIVPGGIVELQEKSIYGSRCENDIRSYNIDVALLAVNAVSIKKGITDFRFNEIGIINAMLDASDKKYVLADSSKFDNVSCMNICDLGKIDGFLTEKGISNELAEKYRQKGYKLYIN